MTQKVNKNDNIQAIFYFEREAKRTWHGFGR